MRRLILAILLFCSLVLVVEAKHKKDVPLAPLPAPILHAKTVFLANAGGSDLAYDAFYQAMKAWNRFTIVDSPEKADLIFELSYAVVDQGTHVWSSTNTYTGQSQVHSAHLTDPQVHLTVYDGKSREPLWSTLQHRDLARMERNREKNTIKAAEQLVEEFRHRVESAASN